MSNDCSRNSSRVSPGLIARAQADTAVNARLGHACILELRRRLRAPAEPQSTSIDVFRDGLVPCDGHQDVEILVKDEQPAGIAQTILADVLREGTS